MTRGRPYYEIAPSGNSFAEEDPEIATLMPIPASLDTGVDAHMGNPSRIESVGGVDRVLAGPRSALSRTPSVSILEKLKKSERTAAGDPPWVIYANGDENGLLYDLRAAKVISRDARAVVLRNGDFSFHDPDSYCGSPVVLARPDLDREELMDLCQGLQSQGRQVWVLSPSMEVFRGRAPMKEIRGVPLVRLGSPRSTGLRGILKRAVDILGASAATVLLSPLLIAAGIAVKLSSPGPILFKQRRVGRNGRPFNCYKFRSMVVNNDQSIHRRYWEGLRGNGQEASVDKSGKRVYKLVDDPRVTGLGRILRRWSLDELPQLFNVLLGHMSLVGPRPCLIYEWDSYSDWHKKRLSVNAGITGLWQVTGRSNVNFDEMVLLDLYYAANWSLGMDIKLMFRTIPAVINGDGAH